MPKIIQTWEKKRLIDLNSLIKAKIDIKDILSRPLSKCTYSHHKCSVYPSNACPLAWQGKCLNTFREGWNK